MTKESMLAAVANRAGQDSQVLLAGAAEGWRAAGFTVAGVVAQDNDAPGACSAGFLRDIASGALHSIHLDTPPADTACHLDAGGLDGACAGLLGQIDAADVVVLSKFGKMEAMRQGLWPVFAAASASGKPLLTTVSPKHREAWGRVAPDAVWLGADGPSIQQWWQALRRRAAT